MANIIIPGVDDVEAFLKREYGDVKHERKPHGIIFENGREIAHTLQCPHCGSHFISRKGSGHRRSFCLHCEAVTCGAPACVSTCTPFAAQLGMNQGREV